MAVPGFFDYATPDTPRPDRDELLFLAGRTDADWARLLAGTQTRRFRAGEVLVRAGELDPSLYILTEGRVEVVVLGRGGRSEHQLATFGPGSVVGELAFLDGRPRSAGNRALTDGAMLRLSREAFDQLAARDAELARAILLDLGRILALRLRLLTAAMQRSWA